MKKSILTVAVVLSSLTSVFGQWDNKNHFEFELDPLAYSIGGGSGHVAYTWKNERVQLGYGQLTMPEAMSNHEGVTESFKAIAGKWDYFFGQDDASHGFFAGPTFDYVFLEYKDQSGNEFKDNQLNLGVRAGYKFDLFKSNKTLNGLYLTPWVGTSWLTKPSDYQLGDKTYSRKAFTFFPKIHLGYTF